jgi:hypothetical protein
MGKKLFFSLQGVDFNDDEAIEAFAHQVWEQATAEFTAQAADPDDTDKTLDSKEGNQE